MTPVRHFLLFTLYGLISEFRLLFIEYSIAKSLRDGSSREKEYVRQKRRRTKSEGQKGAMLHHQQRSWYTEDDSYFI